MTRYAAIALLACSLAGCPRKPEPGVRPAPARAAPRRMAPRSPTRPKPVPGPLEQRASFDFDRVPFPDVIGALERDHGLRLGISGSIPFERWARHTVTLRMRDVERRAFLDWLVRPLGAMYAIEEKGGVWLARDDELLLTAPLELRTCTVATHVSARPPLRGSLSFVKEQRLIVDTAESGLRLLFDRRKGCRLAFHGEQDILVARLPARGHRRLAAVLDAMRHGTEPPGLPSPTLHELRAKLRAPVTCDGQPKALGPLLWQAARQVEVNFGWDASRLGSPAVTVPQGQHALADVLRAVVAQTKVGRYALEPGRGIWLYAAGEPKRSHDSGATPWDRAVVRAFDVRPLLMRSSRESILKRLQTQVDSGRWQRGLPSAAIFTPTARLIVVHDPAGQQRVASAVQGMLEEALAPPGSAKEQ